MSETTISETCGCGASFTTTAPNGGVADRSAREWREGHKHAEAVGICGDRAPMLIPKGSDMAPMFCDLKAGHDGMHSDGEGHWAPWSAIHEANLRTLKHEAETPMRGHDEDGACCRNAAMGVTT